MNTKKTKFDYFEISTLENDGAVNKALSLGELWEPHIINFLKVNHNKEKNFIDAGSNFGWHSLIASKFFKSVYSFEPQKLLCELQEQSIKDSNISNISVYNVGLGEAEYKSSLVQAFYNVPNFNTGAICIGNGGNEIIIKTLDSYNFNNIDTIKIDVQCYEDKLISGATKLITTHKPNLIVELECNSEFVFSQLRSLNYYCFYLDYSYPVDHVFVHYSKLKDFRKTNEKFIFPHNTTNNWNNNVENGVFEKLCYDR